MQGFAFQGWILLPLVRAPRQRCFGLGAFAEEVNIQVIPIKQCACPRKTPLSKDNWCLLPPVRAAKAEGGLAGKNIVRKC